MPNVSNLVPFGTVLNASPHDATPAKFEAKAHKFIVIGYYTRNTKAYQLYDVRSVIFRTDVIRSHNEPESPVTEQEEEPVVRKTTIPVVDDPETETASQTTHADSEEQIQSNSLDISSRWISGYQL